MSSGSIRPSPKRKSLDITALVLLPVGGIVLPVLGWIIGVILLWKSPTWTTRGKLIGTLVIPGGLVIPWLIGYAFVPGWGACPGEAYRTLPDGTDQLIRPELCVYDGDAIRPWGAIMVAVLSLASIAAVIYLARGMRMSRP